jgi:ketosteroid isomerase-like protein
MRTILRTFAVVAVVAGASACDQQGSGLETNSAAADETARQAQEAYVAAINTNDLDSLLAMLTEDVVYLPPNEPALVGKAAVRPWAAEYLKAFKIHWEKTSLEFVVAGDWAFERYSYESTDTPQGAVRLSRTPARASTFSTTTRMVNGAWHATLGAVICRYRP